MENSLDHYIKDVNSLIEIRNKIRNNEISASQDDLSLFEKTFRQALEEASVKADFFFNQDYSDVSIITLKELLKTFSVWGNWGLNGRTKPSDVVKKIKEEIKKRKFSDSM